MTTAIENPGRKVTDRLDDYFAVRRDQAQRRYDELVLAVANEADIEPAVVDEILSAAEKSADDLERDVRMQFQRFESEPICQQLEFVSDKLAEANERIDSERKAWETRIAFLESDRQRIESKLSECEGHRSRLVNSMPAWLRRLIGDVLHEIRQHEETIDQWPRPTKDERELLDWRVDYSQPEGEQIAYTIASGADTSSAQRALASLEDRIDAHQRRVGKLHPRIDRLRQQVKALEALALTAVPKREEAERILAEELPADIRDD